MSRVPHPPCSTAACRSSLPRRSLCFALLVALLAPMLASAQSEGGGELKILDKTRVYFGKPNSYTKPSKVQFKKVAPHIPEYRRIKEKGLKPTDAEYQLLVGEGTKVFRTTVKEVARKKGYDMVVEQEAIIEKGIVLPDLTKEIIRKLGGTP